ncbi:uncharacterized protein LOC122513075 [Leptopilina heterotoma]|uniref:uncharacterized protein LOC122513075 n=1 Tax=Leptopilina heterotoma TaxID=63436 RepID=UPI001CA8BD3B|nr:uncharacterized protein LOC122513075 [Leptopilina heterotoma]
MPSKKMMGPQGGTLLFAEIFRSSLAGANVAEGYPRVQMTLANLDQLRVTIHDEIGGDEVGPYPHIGEVRLTRGAILVECLDSESREWLNSRIPRFSQALGGLAIKVVDPAELIKLINLHHCKGASAIFAKSFTKMQTALAFIQEPWVFKGRIRGLNGCGELVRLPQEPVPRACLIYKGLDAFPLLELTTRDLAVVKAKHLEKNGNKREVVIASAYFPGTGDEPAPPREVESTDINDRGRRLLDFLLDTDLDILNQGNEPTFVTVNRKEVLDITICSKSLCDGVRDWSVSDEDSLLDHRLITFRLESKDREQEWGRNPRSTDWASYSEDLKASMACFPTSYGTREELELAAEYLRDSIICSFERICVVKKIGFNGGGKWWTPRLEERRKTVRKLFNKAKKRRHQRAWDEYHTARDSYNKEVERARGVSWRRFCEGIERVPEASRLYKVLARDPMAKLTTIKLPNRQYAQDKRECLKHLIKVNFPDFREGLENSHGIGRGRNRGYREH